MKPGHQEVARTAGAIAGEHAAGAVGAVRGRRQPDDQQPRRRITEARHRSRPVRFIAVGTPLLAADPLTVLAQPWTALARDDLFPDDVESPQLTTNAHHEVTKGTKTLLGRILRVLRAFVKGISLEHVVESPHPAGVLR